MFDQQVSITCPKCGEQFGITLTEALTKPVLDAAVDAKLADERERITSLAEQKQAGQFKARLAAMEQEVATARSVAAKAEQAELEALRQCREAQDAKRQVELEVERQVQRERARIRDEAKREEQERHVLVLEERDKVIADMKRDLEDLRRHSDTGSIQLRGEVFELHVEAMLRTAFPTDRITPVPTGRAGCDVIHEVVGPNGTTCGKVVWEFKNVKNWSPDYIAKARDDQRKAEAHIAVIVTTTLPREIAAFDKVGGVWVSSLACALPLAKALRAAIVGMSMVSAAVHGREERATLVYSLIASERFRAFVSGIVDACTALYEGTQTQKRYMTRQWARQSKSIEQLITSTADMYGALQSVAGNALLGKL